MGPAVAQSRTSNCLRSARWPPTTCRRPTNASSARRSCARSGATRPTSTIPETRDYLQNLGFQLVSNSPARYTDFQFFAIKRLDPQRLRAARRLHRRAHRPGPHRAERIGTRLGARPRDRPHRAAPRRAHAVEAEGVDRDRDRRAAAGAARGTQQLVVEQRDHRGCDRRRPGRCDPAQLNFSREAEREADRIGFQILVDGGFDPRAMATFFGRMQQGTRIYESAAPEYLRSHPLTSDRMADIQSRLRETRTRQRPDSLEFQLVRARLRVLQEDTVQGARDAVAFFNADAASRGTRRGCRRLLRPGSRPAQARRGGRRGDLGTERTQPHPRDLADARQDRVGGALRGGQDARGPGRRAGHGARRRRGASRCRG